MDEGGKGQGQGARRASPGLTELIGRALTDEKFRKHLFTNRAEAVTNFQLTDADMEALDSLSEQDLEAHAQRFGEGSASAMAVSVVVKGTF